MNEDDDKLRDLLCQWREIEPSDDFEANVWRQIRLAQAETPRPFSIFQLLQHWLWQPRFCVATGAFIAMMIGTSVGFYSGRSSPRSPTSSLVFLSPDTLAGSYVRSHMERTR